MYQPATPPEHAQATRLGRIATILIIALAAAGLPGCDEKDPTGTELTTSTEGGQAGTQGVEASAITADATGVGPAIVAIARTGAGGTFSSSGKETLLATNDGSGAAIHGVNTELGNAAAFENVKSTNGLPVLAVTNRAGGFAAVFGATTANGKGVLIQTQSGAVGLQVVNGTKNAVVATPSGAKALYTEESTEVWFTDYGFGKLEKGRARILFDPSFAQTINPDEPYHVFLQARGR